MSRFFQTLFLLGAGAAAAPASVPPVPWPAVDGLGRVLPLASETGPPRGDRTVAMFYFLWHGPHAQAGGPWDVSRILAKDPEAMRSPDNPMWGPLHAPHHWGESIFGYYTTDDPYVLRKHAQMLTDAGVDTVVFDVTNQLTYQAQYSALLETWSAIRAAGGRTPQVAFLCPFWQPARVVRELWADLYEPGRHRDLWFHWDGKPLILADPERLQNEAVTHHLEDRAVEVPRNGTLGQAFTVDRPWLAVSARVPTWHAADSAVTLSVRRGGPDGAVVATRRFERIVDNDWLRLTLPAVEAGGRFLLEMHDASGRVGWWSSNAQTVPGGAARTGLAESAGGRSLRIEFEDPVADRIRAFFTFRTPQPDYFRGPTQPDMWAWLEVHPQHVFRNRRGEKEQMAVGVAQNAVHGRLGSMSESAGARGRSFHRGARDTRPGAVALGLNFAEQIEHALREDPRTLFITGWNEWIAGRHAEFNGVREPVMFVDQFNHEYSRDLEPMKGGHGDAYYYQFVAAVRRYKGTPALPEPTAPKAIDVQGPFSQWDDVAPAFTDDAGDTAHRDHPGYANHTRYVNRAGRNDIILAKSTRLGDARAFFVATRDPLTCPDEGRWMWLLLDSDGDPRTGWEGFDHLVNRTPPVDGRAMVEKCVGGWKWEPVGTVPIRWEGRFLHLSIPSKLVGATEARNAPLDFKWADHVPETGDIVSWLDAGDTAPNARFVYRLPGGW